MNQELLEAVRAANREFGDFIRIASSTERHDKELSHVTQRLGFVQLRLKHVSRCLAAAGDPSLDASAGASEIEQYRENLKSLQDVIQSLQASLLLEKGRLNKVRSNVRAARAWADSVRAYS